MNEDFVSFEIAKKLKEKGFNEGCYKYYENKELKWSNSPWLETQYNSYMPHIIAAPTISQVLKWLREEKKIHIEIFLYDGKYSYLVKSITQICEDDLFHKCLNEDTVDEEYQFYEKAALAGIEYVLDNLI